jgi:nitrogen fixation protein FixH
MWPIIIVGLILLNVALCAVTVVAAVMSSRTATTESNYYQKALEWDHTQAERRASEALGWSVHLDAIALNAGGGRWLLAEVTDREGRPLSGARLSAEVFHRADPRGSVAVELTQVIDGVYRAFVPIDRHGIWEVRTRTVHDRSMHVQSTTLIVMPRELTRRPAGTQGVQP